MKKRLVSWLLAFVLVVGMLPTSVFASLQPVVGDFADTVSSAATEVVDSLTSSDESGSGDVITEEPVVSSPKKVNAAASTTPSADEVAPGILKLQAKSGGQDSTGGGNDTSSGGKRKAGLWKYKPFVRMTITRFAGDGASGIYSADSTTIDAAQSTFNAALKASAGSSQDIIIDVITPAAVSAITGRDVYLTNSTVVDYALAGTGTGVPQKVSLQSVGTNVWQVSGTSNHFIVVDSNFNRYVSTSPNNPGFGYGGSTLTNSDAIFNFMQGGGSGLDAGYYKDYVTGEWLTNGSGEDLPDVLRKLGTDGDSMFKKLGDFCNTYASSFYGIVAKDAENVEGYLASDKSDAGTTFTFGFNSPYVESGYFYLLSFELGESKIYSNDSLSGFSSSSPIYFYTTRDSSTRVRAEGKGDGWHLGSPYYQNMLTTDGMTVAHLDDGKTKATSNFWMQPGNSSVTTSSSDPGRAVNKGGGLWLVSGYQAYGGGSSTVSVAKNAFTNLPDSYAEAVLGTSFSSMKFPITITISNAPGSVVNFYGSVEEASQGTGTPIASAPVTNGSATVQVELGSGETLYAYYDGDPTAAAPLGGLSEGATITVSEDVSQYAELGMVSIIHTGSVPSGYKGDDYKNTMFSSTEYTDLMDADTTVDGYDVSSPNSPASYTVTLTGSNNIVVENWWIGYVMKKTLTDYDTVEPSEIMKEQTESLLSDMSEEAKAYYGDADIYKLGSYYYAYIPTDVPKYFAPGATEGNWDAAYTSSYCLWHGFDESGALVGSFTAEDLGIVGDNKDVYRIVPVKPGCEMLITDPSMSFETAVVNWCGGYGSVHPYEPHNLYMRLVSEYGGTDETSEDYFSFKTVGTQKDGSSTDFNVLSDKTIEQRLNELIAESPSYSTILQAIQTNHPEALDDKTKDEYDVDGLGVDMGGNFGGDMYCKAEINNTWTPSGGGDCHLVIDMNLDGQPLYAVATDGQYKAVQVASETIDCGGFGDGDTVDLSNFPLKTMTLTITGLDGKQYTATCEPLGIFDAAEGGNQLKSFTFTHSEPDEEGDGYNDLHVLWVQWKITMDIKDSGEIPPAPSEEGTLASSGWHTVYWDYGYTGAAVTSTQIGVTTQYASGSMEGSYGLGSWNGSVIKYNPYLIYYELDVPAIPERVGWTFLGWFNMGLGNDDNGGSNSYPNWKGDDKYKPLWKDNDNGMDSLYSMGLFDSGTKLTYQDRADHMVFEYEELADLIEAVARGEADASEIEGTTFRAFWSTQPVVWHSMGGTYINRNGEPGGSGTTTKLTNCFYSNNVWTSGVTNPNPSSCSAGHNHAHQSDWSGEHTSGQLDPSYLDDCETYVRNAWQSGENEFSPIVVEPVRTGYTFMGWYFDPYCSVPITEFEVGIQPRRHYYAGWEAEDVIINYYDTREGTGLIGTQTVSYADAVDLWDVVWSTSGWESVGWTVDPETTGQQGAIIDGSNQEWRADPGLAYGTTETAYKGSKFLEDCNATYFPPTGSGFEDPDHGTGAVENEGYWVVNLYADYTIKTTSYTVTIHWDDFKNNDGCRPKQLEIGLITSVGNTICAKQWVTGPSDADTWTYTFSDLPITVSDSNTDIINYTFCVLGYEDANGNYGEIKDTQSGNGEILVTTPTDHSTDATSSYRYDIGWYQTDGSDHFFETPNNRPLAMAADAGEGEGTFGSTDQSVVYIPYAGTLYMTHDLILTGDDIVFTIEWDDDSNRDGVRPEYVMLQLWAADGNGNFTLITTGDDTLAGNSQNGTVAVTEAMCQVSEDGNTWVYTFEDYQKYTNQGELVVYGFSVNPQYLTDGYSVQYMDGDEQGPDTNGVTLSYGVTTSDVVYSVNWHDNQNQDGLRPDKVVVELIAYQWNEADGKYESMTVGTQEVTGRSTNEVWQGVFRDMYVYHDGMPVTYRLKVVSDLNGNIDDDSNGYTWSEGVVGNQYVNPVRPSVDIYHNADTRDVTATVQWDDNNNNDHSRPDSVILQLYADNKPVPGEDYRVVLTGDATALTWTHTFEDVDIYRYDGTGDEVTYTIGVESVRGGDLVDYESWYLTADGEVTNARSASTEPFMMLEYVPVTDTVNGAIYWQDESNRDGERPGFVDVALMAHVYNKTTNQYIDYVAETMTVSLATDPRNTSTADVWYFQFDDMPVYRDTEPVTYYLEVTSDLNGNITETAKAYNWSEKSRGDMDSTDNLEVAVNIYQRTEVRDVTGTIEWMDDHNNDGIRPSSVVLQLYADGVKVEGEQYTAVVSGNMTADQWTYTFENLPRYRDGESGKEIVYTVYVSEVTQGSLYGHMEERSITGEPYDYTRYTASYATSTDDLYTENFSESAEPFVRLTHENNTMDVPVTVVWQDENNRDGQRPKYITLQLTAYQWNADTAAWEYKEVATTTIQSDEELNTMTASEWTTTFGEHPVYHDGERIIYHLAVNSNLNEFIPDGSYEYGWVETAYGNQTEAVPEVTVSQNINTTSVQATIYWNDKNNNDDIRPTNVVVQLYSHVMGETPEPVPGIAYRVNLTGDMTADNWTYTFSGMPRFAEGLSGVELIYTIEVIEADGEPLYGTYISTANGEEEEVTRYEASYLKEIPETNETETTTDFNESDRAYVQLTHIPETRTDYFYVNWHDNENQDNVRPTSVMAELYKTVGNGSPIYLKTIELFAGENGDWLYEIGDLPGYENGEKVVYTVAISDDVKAQLADIGYTTVVEDNVIHMYYTPETGTVTTQIRWEDEDDNDGYRTEKVMAQLHANGTPVGQPVELNELNGWSWTWKDLPVHYTDGTEVGTNVVYSVTVEAPDGYTATYRPETTTIEADEIIYVELFHGTDVADVPVTIYWNDNSNNDGVRPESMKIMLLADDEETYYTAVLTPENASSGSDNVWEYVFQDLPVYSGNGERIYYEVIVYDDATWSGAYDSLTTGTTMYMSHEVALSDLYVSFQFRDNNNADGMRPTGLYIQLTADGIPVDDSEYVHTVSFDTNVDGYRLEFGALPVYRTDGTKIRYNVDVRLDPVFGSTDYVVSKTDDIELSEHDEAAVNQIIVILSKDAETTSRTGYIYWFDCNNRFGNRPNDIPVALYNNLSKTATNYNVNAVTGEVTNVNTGEVVGTVEVKEWTGDSSVWVYTINGLPANFIDTDGTSAQLNYWASVNNASISTYYPTVVTGEQYGMYSSLTHRYYEQYADQAAQDFTVNLQWLDNSNAWGYRPDSNGVMAELLANGEVYAQYVLTQGDASATNPNLWTYTWRDLPTFRDGSGISYTVRLTDVDKYTQEQSIASAESATVLFTQSIGFDFTVNWNDSDNDDAVRPDDVTLTVYGDGSPVGEVVMTGDGNTWTGSIEDLPVWRKSDGDAAVQYTFNWNDETDTYLHETGYVAEPTQNGMSVDSSHFYYLSASQFGDNNDAGYDVLDGTYDWETTLSYNKEVADYRFTVTFVDDVDRDGIRPTELTVNLLANGELFDTRTIAVNLDESVYTLLWEDLEVWDSGESIDYTIEVVTEPDDYVISYNEQHTAATLTHQVYLVDVTGVMTWDDSTELKNVYNPEGDFVRTYNQVDRKDVYMQLLADGEPYGEPVLIPAETYGEGENLDQSATVLWEDLHQFRDNGTEIVYTIQVYSAGLTGLLDDGHTLTYNFDTKYQPEAIVTHDLYDIRGTVYYQTTMSDDFLLDGVPVTAYVYDEEAGQYKSMGSTVTDEHGNFEFLNLPQGLYTIRATYQYGQDILAGTQGANLDRRDTNDVIVIVDRDAANDSDFYLYTATGQAFYQTDETDPDTIRPVPEGSIVLLYKVVDGQTEPVYMGMDTTDADGRYQFTDLSNADYLVNVVFNHGNGTYTYDNGDAVEDGLSFVISGGDIVWPDIIKQVNADVGVIDPDNPEPEPEPEPEPGPQPCIVDGYVYYADNGVHTTDPVSGVDVYVYMQDTNIEVGKDTTDDTGYWSVEGLPVGAYTAVFSYQGNASRVLLFNVTESAFEAGTYRANPQYFDRYQQPPTGTIQGVVLDETGSPCRSMVAIYNDNGEMVDFSYTDMYGFYTFTVVAGYDYRVKIVKVEDETTRYTAGDPDDDLTTLDYYTLSGRFTIDGVAQENVLVAVYYQNKDGGYDIVTATLTDADGNYEAKVYAEGNYRVVPYVNDEIYATWNVSVGYQEERPTITQSVTGTYTLTGSEDYESLYLYWIDMDDVRHVEKKIENSPSDTYAFYNLNAGRYELKLVKADGTEVWYYFTAPTDSTVKVDYYVTVSGDVVDSNGTAVIGSTVNVYDASGKPVGDETLILSDGHYSYSNLPAGEYTVVVTKPHASEVLAEDWTYNEDSYGIAYSGGMGADGVWTLNVNAHQVSGKVMDAYGNSVANVSVMFTNAMNDQSYAVSTGEDGTYRIGLPTGGYDIRANLIMEDGRVIKAQGISGAVIMGDMKNVDFVVYNHNVTIETLRDADGNPAAGANVEVYFNDEIGGLAHEGQTGEDGTLDVLLYPGEYRITAEYDGATVETLVTIDSEQTVTLRLDSVVYVTGTVTNLDGEPVGDAIVYYTDGGDNSGRVYTDDEGKYQIPISSDDLGKYEFYAVSGGNESEHVTTTVASDTEVNLVVSSETVTGEFVISGQVTDEDGNLLPNAIVTLLRGDDKVNVAETSTNSLGEYAFHVEPGTYYLEALYEADGGHTYYTNDEYAVHVVDGDEVQNLRVLMAYDVTVTVLDASGRPVDNATVYYEGTEVSGSESAGSDGVVVLHLPKGQYEFYAKADDRTSKTVMKTVEGTAEVMLTLDNIGIRDDAPIAFPDDGLSIFGWVYDTNGQPVENAEVRLWEQDFETLEWSEIKGIYTDTEGRYFFEGLPAGIYRVDTNFTQKTVVTTDDSSYEISGQLTDEQGNPLSNCEVILYNAADMDEIARTITDDYGNFVFESLEQYDQFSPDAVYQVEAHAASGIITEEYTAQSVPGSDVISGVVTDVAGRPVEGAQVIIKTQSGDTVATELTDGTGAYSVAVNGEGEYTLEITYPASYEVDTETYVRDTTDRNAPYLTASWYTIEGYVHDMDGRPVEGATVILRNDEYEEVERCLSAEDGYYIFDHLQDGIYYVEIIFDGETEKVYEVNTGNGTSEDVTPDKEPEAPVGINVNVVNWAEGTASIKEPAGGWVTGDNQFIVTSENVVKVLHRNAAGELEELECTAGEFENEYVFYVDELEDGDEIILVLCGDADLDGTVDFVDATTVNQYMLHLVTFDEDVQMYAADADCDGTVDFVDATAINQYMLRLATFHWNLR